MKGLTEKLIDDRYKEQKEMRLKGCTWIDLFNTTYRDEPTPSGAFIRLVEEENNIKVTSPKQLQELTGIKEVESYFDENNKEVKIKTKAERKEEAYRQIENAFLQAMELRYEIALRNLLEKGAKYKDLLLLTPSDFNLPETWETYEENDKEIMIKEAICLYFNLTEPLLLRLDLRSIAKLIEAPYEVILEASKIFSYKD